jgi:hypothetical protein
MGEGIASVCLNACGLVTALLSRDGKEEIEAVKPCGGARLVSACVTFTCSGHCSCFKPAEMRKLVDGEEKSAEATRQVNFSGIHIALSSNRSP